MRHWFLLLGLAAICLVTNDASAAQLHSWHFVYSWERGADDFWGGYHLSSEDILNPPASIQIDDFGSRPDHVEMIKRLHAEAGVKAISIGINSELAKADPTLRGDYPSIVEQLRDLSNYLNNNPDLQIEFFQHFNWSIDFSQHLDDRGAVDTLKKVSGFHRGFWLRELDRRPIVNFLAENGIQIEANDIKGVVYPGDQLATTGADRDYLRRHFTDISAVMDSLGYKWAALSGGGPDSTITPLVMSNMNAPGLATSRNGQAPFYLVDHPDLFMIALTGTMDIGSGDIFVERGAPPWRPSGSEEWLLEDRIPTLGAGGSMADSYLGNYLNSMRYILQAQDMQGGGWQLTFHSDYDTRNTAGMNEISLIEPTPALVTPSTASHTSGTFGDFWDPIYAAASITARLEQGHGKWVTRSEHFAWQSRSAKPQQYVWGDPTGFHELAFDIGDTLGAGPAPGHFKNFGAIGIGNLYPLDTNAVLVDAGSILTQDNDADGSPDSPIRTNWADAAYTIVREDSISSRQSTLIIKSETHEPILQVTSHGLPRGHYEYAIQTQNVDQIEFVRPAILHYAAYFVDNSSESQSTPYDGVRKYAFYTVPVDTLMSATLTWPSYMTAFTDPWPGGNAPAAASERGAWEVRIPFTTRRPAVMPTAYPIYERWFFTAQPRLKHVSSGQDARVRSMTIVKRGELSAVPQRNSPCIQRLAYVTTLDAADATGAYGTVTWDVPLALRSVRLTVNSGTAWSAGNDQLKIEYAADRDQLSWTAMAFYATDLTAAGTSATTIDINTVDGWDGDTAIFWNGSAGGYEIRTPTECYGIRIYYTAIDNVSGAFTGLGLWAEYE